MLSKRMKFKQGCVCDRGNIVGREKSKTRTSGYHREQTKPRQVVQWPPQAAETTQTPKQRGAALQTRAMRFLNASLFRFLSHHICQWVFHSSRSKRRGSWDLLSWWKLSEPVEDTVENFKKEQNWLSVCLTSGAWEPASSPCQKGKGQGCRGNRDPLARKDWLSPIACVLFCISKIQHSAQELFIVK